MPDTVISAYDPTLYHDNPLTAILYARNSGFDVDEGGKEALAFREDMPGSLFTLTKVETRWCWMRTT